MTRPPLRLALPIAVHVALCLLHLWFVADSPLLRYLTLDLKSYDSWARAILAGDVLGKQVFYQDPLYPYLMALVYWIGGAQVVHVLLVQVAGSAVTVYLTYRLTDRLFGLGAATLAVWAAALYGPAVYYAAKPEKASLAALAVTASLWALVRAREGGARWWLAAGALLGLGSLLRGNVLLVAARRGRSARVLARCRYGPHLERPHPRGRCAPRGAGARAPSRAPAEQDRRRGMGLHDLAGGGQPLHRQQRRERDGHVRGAALRAPEPPL